MTETRIKLKTSLPVLLSTTLLISGCMAHVGAEGVTVPPDSAAICAEHCDSIGMKLTAVAIMADNVGCVCQPASESSPSADAATQGSAPAAGMTTILMQQAAAEQQRRQAQNNQK